MCAAILVDGLLISGVKRDGARGIAASVAVEMRGEARRLGGGRLVKLHSFTSTYLVLHGRSASFCLVLSSVSWIASPPSNFLTRWCVLEG